jgi:hypothetical protein
MPKDEFDFEDPLELNGVAFPTCEDTTDAMCECFIEEFMRMGYSAQRILGLFRNPQYLGVHMAWQKRGEQHLRDTITETFARWGRPVIWPAPNPAPHDQALGRPATGPAALTPHLNPTGSGPAGGAAPNVNLPNPQRS